MAALVADAIRSSSPEQRPRQIRALYKKCLLFFCWLLAMVQIWVATDNNSSDDFIDPTFGAPGREVGMVEQNNDGIIGIGVNGREIALEPEKTIHGREMGAAGDKMNLNNGTSTALFIGQTNAHHSEVFLEALQSITSKKCCMLASNTKVMGQKSERCFGTCYTERACDDPIYPFNSAEEKALFPRVYGTSLRGKNQRRLECNAPEKMVPPVEWCQKPVEKRKEVAAHLVDGIPPAGCSLMNNGGGSGAFQHVIIFPSAKLAFCGIPKVGITQWEQFLRFYIGAKDYPSSPHNKLDRHPFQFDRLDPQVQRRIWEDKDWTWAAFVRNPAERLLSAYLDKVSSKRRQEKYGAMSLEVFIDHLSNQSNFTNCRNSTRGVHDGLTWCTDPHWRPQVYSCGISERLDRFQFIGDLHSAADHTRELLSHVGLWESHGKHFINGGIKEKSSCNIASHSYNHTVHVGFQQKDEVTNTTAANTVYNHSTGSRDKMEMYFTPELIKKVQDELYADDYKLWKLVSANGKKLSHGTKLASHLSNECDIAGEPKETSEKETGLVAEDQVSIHNLTINETIIHKIKFAVSALQPVNFQECCIPAMHRNDNNPEDVLCFGTCYSRRACNSTTYPFNSAEEKALFPMATPIVNIEEDEKFRQECEAPDNLVPPVEWCQKPHHGNQNESSAHLVDGISPAGCSAITRNGGSGAFQHVIIFPSAKLAFCGIPKVGITKWEQFLRFYIGAKDYPSLPHFKMDRKPFQFDALDAQVQRRIWEDEEWTWAAFIRNPAERLLSAYLDKVSSKRGQEKYGSISFEKFVHTLSQRTNFTNCNDSTGSVHDGMTWCTDPHWRPQVYSCGMSERLDRFQFIGDLDNAADQTRELLSDVGLWDSHGKHFINGGVRNDGKVMKNSMCNVMSHPFNHTTHVGFQQADKVSDKSASNTVYGHSKGSRDKMKDHFTPELLKKVEEDLYADDYKLWKLVSGNGKKMSKGKKLASHLSRNCRR